MPVTRQEMDGSPREQHVRNGFKATMRIKFDWSDRGDLANEVMWTSFGLGELYPHDVSTGARAVAMTIEPFGAQLGDLDPLGNYTSGIATIEYATPDPVQPQSDGGGGTIISESFEPFVEFLTLDHNEFRWTSGAGTPLTAEEAPGRQIFGYDYVFTRYNETTLPTAAINLIGSVNQAAVSFNFMPLPNAAAETLLMRAPTIQRSTDNAGTDYYTITYRFTFRADGWNKFLRGGNSAEAIYIASGGEYKPYPTGDFTLL